MAGGGIGGHLTHLAIRRQLKGPSLSASDKEQPASSMLARMIGASRLDERIYKEVGADSRAIFQAVGVVMLAAMATRAAQTGVDFPPLVVAIFRLSAWWAALTLIIYLLAITLFRTSGSSPTWGRVARSMGFAQSPVILRGILIFPFIPGILWFLIFFAVLIWQFAAITVAVRQALSYESTARTAILVAVALVPMLLIEPFLLTA